MSPSRTRLFFVCLTLLFVIPRAALAVVPPKRLDALHARVVAPAGFVATVAPEPLETVSRELDAATLSDVAAFRSHAGGAWSFFVDRRSGGMALVEGSGLAWGSALSFPALEARARALMDAYPNLFHVPSSQLVFDARASVHFGETGHLWSIVFRQVVDGVPVEGASVVFRVSRGNLVQFGVDRTIPMTAFTASRGVPVATPAAAKAALASHVGGLSADDTFTEDGTLRYVPRGTADVVGYGGLVGRGWDPTLVYRFVFRRRGQAGAWKALVDAHGARVVRFTDANEYASVLAKGSVYTSTNCADTSNCVPGSNTEVPITLPFARLNFIGGTCTGDGCYTNSAGAYSYPMGAVAASTTLDGKYFRIVDACGAISGGAAAPAGIDLGTSDPNPPVNTNTDCQPATHASDSMSAVTGGNGDTHSARNTFYHLNLIGQKARFYLPANEWLKGVDGATGSAVQVNTNVAAACNAFWQGSTGTLNFERVTPGLFCNNTGEIPEVFLHEFGHGLDQNDATGTAPESATGEAMGDTFAILEGQSACLGPGFFLSNITDPVWGNTAGYGSATTGSSSRLCTGVRDADYTKFCARDAAACLSGLTLTTRDADIVQGSRSGPTPPPEPVADAGMPSRWNNMLSGASSTMDGKTNFYNCGGPETTGCAGPLNHGCHCESTIASQANYDLIKQLIATEFGGSVYTVPQAGPEVSGWQYMDRLWYLTRDLALSAYSVTGPEPTGTTNGCGISNWFETYRFVDDDDGNLANGTPHAGIIYSAFNLHAIACGNAGDPANASSGCPAPLAAPTLSSCDMKSPVQLSWTAVPGAASYRILRNTLGCGFGFKPIAVVPGTQLYYEDPEVAPGVSYYYRVQPVGANPSCYGQTSNCITVTPTTCAASPLSAPTGVMLGNATPNQIQVSWNAVPMAASYKIYRKDGNCASMNSYVAVGTVLAPTTMFTDASGIQGTLTYSYQVVASDSSCAACTSAPSTCASIAATGTCTLAPTFAGATKVVTATGGTCKLTVNWAAGAARCGATLTYSVYRSTDPNFTPSPANRIAMGVSGTSYDDLGVIAGTRYYYVVRATDGSGNSDTNTVRRDGIPIGSLMAGTFTDDAGDTVNPVHFTPSPTAGNTWTIRASGTNNATKQYATTASGNYAVNSCMGLESETLFLGSDSMNPPVLSFRSRYDMEQGWDGGYVDVSTEDGGFSDWTKLTTVNYPGIMAGPLGDPACGGPGFTDGQPVFTGTSANGMWATFSGSLSGYLGKHVRIRFLFSSDSATVAEGWFLDDISVSNVEVPSPPATATVTGSTTICVGQSAMIQAALTGTPPWNLTWSDSFVQNNVMTSPATRTVSPTSTTSYTLTSFSDAHCGGIASGMATITVSPDSTAPVVSPPPGVTVTQTLCQ